MQHLNGIVDDLDLKELVYLEGKGPGETEWRRLEPPKSREEAEFFYAVAAAAPFIQQGVEFRFVPVEKA
jgi:hypothetical protein